MRSSSLIKSLSCILAVCMLLLSFSACGKGGDNDKDGETLENEKQILLGTYSDHATDVACYIGDVLYYTLGSRPCIYTYGNGQKQTIYTGGVPVGMNAQGNYLYYLTKNEKTLCRIDVTTGAKESLAAGVSNITQYCLYGGAVFVFGTGSDGSDAVYSLNLSTMELTSIYTFLNREGYSNGFEISIDEAGRYIKIYHGYDAIAIDLENNKIYEISNFISSDYRPVTNFEFADKYVYIECHNYVYTTHLEKVDAFFKTNLETSETEPISQEDFDNGVLKENNTTGLSYKYGVAGIVSANVVRLQRDVYMDGVFQMYETLYASAISYSYARMYVLYENDALLVFEEIMYSASGHRMMILNKDTSQVTEIDFYSTNLNEEYPSGLGGSSVYTGTGWSSSSGGGSNNSSGGADNNSGGANIEPTKPCGLCHGSGQMKCEMCGGDGMMPSLTIVGGGDWEEPCRYCYNGRKQCLACGGDGVIQ